jgi:hypothetical protein
MPSKGLVEDRVFEAEKPRHKSKKLAARVISRKGTSAMIECTVDGLLKRFVLPLEKVVDEQVDIFELEQAAPYGLPIGELLPKVQFTPQRLEQACRERGLWTAEDFVKNPSLVQGALQDALRLDTGLITGIALKHRD